MKYFLLGVFASAVMLYGMSLLYGVTGSTLLADIGETLGGSATSTPIVDAGHRVRRSSGSRSRCRRCRSTRWAPDTYEGAPDSGHRLPVGGVEGGRLRGAARARLRRRSSGASDVWQPLFWVLAALTMTVGNLVALRQTNMVRMLAYSSIAQGGFMLMPLAVVGDSAGRRARRSRRSSRTCSMYAAMNLGAFAVVIAVARKTRSGEISSVRRAVQYTPGLSVAMTIFLFSLAGIPPLGGVDREVRRLQAALAPAAAGRLRWRSSAASTP